MKFSLVYLFYLIILFTEKNIMPDYEFKTFAMYMKFFVFTYLDEIYDKFINKT